MRRFSIFLLGMALCGSGWSCPFYLLVEQPLFLSRDAEKRIEEYTAKYLAPAISQDERPRRELLQKLGQFPAGKKSIDLVSSPTVQEKWVEGPLEGGVFHHFSKDQYGDQYLEAKSYPSLEPFFNIHRNLPGDLGVRLLREAEKDFPRERLSPSDLVLLEPLPQRDPLRSHLGGCLVRLFTEDADKGLPTFEPGFFGMYEHGHNFFIRKDGTYYLYDLASGRGTSPSTLLRRALRKYKGSAYDPFWHSKSFPKHLLITALKSIGTVSNKNLRQKEVEFFVDSIFLFGDIGLRIADQAVHKYSAAITRYEAEEKSNLLLLLPD